MTTRGACGAVYRVGRKHVVLCTCKLVAGHAGRHVCVTCGLPFGRGIPPKGYRKDGR